MIIGVGCDIVQIPRIENIYNSNKTRFLNRIFSKNELKFLPNTIYVSHYIAKRYAAKEAFSKAYGCGIGSRFKFTDIEILNDSHGKPYFSDTTLNKLGYGFKAFLSMSDDYPVAIAYVILSN